MHDSPADRSWTADLGLAAVTIGHDIHLGAAIASESQAVREAILAHELVHVAQQGSAARSAPPARELSPPAQRGGHEDEAETLAPQAFLALQHGLRTGARRNLLPRPLALHGCPEDAVAKMKDRKRELEQTTAPRSGKSFSEVGAAYTELVDVEHDLAVKESGRGLYKGSESGDTSAAKVTDCTEIVFEVLRKTFAQQGKSADWAKVEAKYRANIKARGGGGKGSGLDLQAALQSELGWKGIYWAPDPSFAYKGSEAPQDQRHLSGRVKGDEADYGAGLAKSKGTYYKDFGKKGYPGVSIHQRVTGYGPEKGSTTVADRTGLNKLKKLPFGVMSAHGGHHMTLITSGKVTEVHWRSPATSPDVITQEDLETWAIGPSSGIRYFASGAIVAPAADVDAAFR